MATRDSKKRMPCLTAGGQVERASVPRSPPPTAHPRRRRRQRPHGLSITGSFFALGVRNRTPDHAEVRSPRPASRTQARSVEGLLATGVEPSRLDPFAQNRRTSRHAEPAEPTCAAARHRPGPAITSGASFPSRKSNAIHVPGAAMVSRSNAEIPSGATFLAAWLYRPDRPDGGEKRPLVIMGHGIGGVREMRVDAYAERFAAADLGVLVFDYRYLGASGGQPRQLVSIKRQLEDWASAIAFARRIPWVDPSRIALWGSSFGGGHVLAAAAKDGAVAAAVSQCPFIDGRMSLRRIPIKVLMRVGM